MDGLKTLEMKMRYKKGLFYSISTSAMEDFRGIFLRTKNGKHEFQKIGEGEFNGKFYLSESQITNSEEIDKSRLMLYLNTKDSRVLNEIFKSLYRKK